MIIGYLRRLINYRGIINIIISVCAVHNLHIYADDILFLILLTVDLLLSSFQFMTIVVAK